MRWENGAKSIPALQDKVSGSCTETSAEWTALCRKVSTYRISQSRLQILKKSSDCWHKTQQADSFRCPPVCLTIHKVQKMYLWELSDSGLFFMALFCGIPLRETSLHNCGNASVPSGLHLDDRKSCPDNSAPQEGHTNTAVLPAPQDQPHNTHHHCCWSNGSQGPQAGSSRDHPAEQTHTSDSAGRPLLPGDHAPISLFFLRRHYIMETNNLQGGR